MENAGVNEIPEQEAECVNGDKDVSHSGWTDEWGDSEGDHEANEFHMSGGSRYWEVQHGTEEVQITKVQGRLKEHVVFWLDVLQAPPTVIDWIKNGYKLPLLYSPTPFCQDNHGSALRNGEFVYISTAIRELIENRCVRRCSSRPFICSPLSVVSNLEGKLRLVFNLRHVNQFLRKDRFKYEDLRVAIAMFEKEDFVFKFDLKLGYHHLDILRSIRSIWVLHGSWMVSPSILYSQFCLLDWLLHVMSSLS